MKTFLLLAVVAVAGTGTWIGASGNLMAATEKATTPDYRPHTIYLESSNDVLTLSCADKNQMSRIMYYGFNEVGYARAEAFSVENGFLKIEFTHLPDGSRQDLYADMSGCVFQIKKKK